MANRNMENSRAIQDSLGHGNEDGSSAKDVQYWKTAPREERPSSMEEFKSEVKAKIGLDFDSLPEGTPDDMLGSASLLAFEDWRVVGVGRPDEDPNTGEETYTEFKRINMSSAE